VLEVRALAGVGLRLLAIAALVSLSGCGASTAPSARGPSTATVPQYVSEPFTAREQLIEQGARLIVADGCAACHLDKTSRTIGPSFDDFAGHDVTLADGRHVLVDERFLREALLDPRKDPIEGYDAAPMIAATRRLHLGSHPQQLAALTAFIEQIGPEPG
jgi:cytochrome c5